VNWLAQVFAVTRPRSARSPAPRRVARDGRGIAGVVAGLVAVLSIGEGFRTTLRTAGSPQNALVLRPEATAR
jgi:hypothetical protein